LEKKDLILVVDDDSDFLSSVSTLLRNEGYRVDTARTGAEAIEKCSEEFYALALIDVRLPDMDGIQIMEVIEESDPKMRKIIVTGYPRIEDTQRALDYGAHAYLIKPVDPKTLLEKIEKQLKERENELKERYFLLR